MWPFEDPPVPYLSLWGCSCALAAHCHVRTPPPTLHLAFWGPLHAPSPCCSLRTPSVPYPSLWGHPCAPASCCPLRTTHCPISTLPFEDTTLCAPFGLLGNPQNLISMLPFGEPPLRPIHAFGEPPVPHPSLWGPPCTPSSRCPWGLPPGLLWGRGARQQRVTFGGAARLPAPGREGGEEGTERSLQRSPRRR